MSHQFYIVNYCDKPFYELLFFIIVNMFLNIIIADYKLIV